MKASEEFEKQARKKESCHGLPKTFAFRGNTVAIYTVLTILLKMKRSLGLEAMLEYMEWYRETIENYNPKLKGAVARAVSLMSVARIYKAAMNENEAET